MPFSIVCVAPGASEAQVIKLANSIGPGRWAFDGLPMTVSDPSVLGNSYGAGHGPPMGNSNAVGHGRPSTLPQVPSPDGSPCIREECQKGLASKWKTNQNGPGYSCISCYNDFGTGRKAKAAADLKQTAITQCFSKAAKK
jgi:hypothetical protein